MYHIHRCQAGVVWSCNQLCTHRGWKEHWCIFVFILSATNEYLQYPICHQWCPNSVVSIMYSRENCQSPNSVVIMLYSRARCQSPTSVVIMLYSRVNCLSPTSVVIMLYSRARCWQSPTSVVIMLYSRVSCLSPISVVIMLYSRVNYQWISPSLVKATCRSMTCADTHLKGKSFIYCRTD